MPRNNNSGGSSSRSAPSRSMGSAPAGRGSPPPRGPPARVPSPSAPVKPPPKAPPPGPGAKGGPSAAGMFGASAAGAAVGTMVGSALSRPGEGQAGASSGPQGTDAGYYGKCASQFTLLLQCADYYGGDLDKCAGQADDLNLCHSKL